MIRRSFMALAAVALFAWSPASQAGFLTAVSSKVELIANAQASENVSVVTDTDTQSQGGTLNNLTAFVLAQSQDGDAEVNTTGGVTATWSSSDAGVVRFSEMGWNSANVINGSANLYDPYPDDFAYEFTANADGVLVVDYNIIGLTSELFGLNGFGIQVAGSSSIPTFQFIPSVGQAIFALQAGNTYTLEIGNFANISGGLGTRESYMNGTFEFSFRRIPEPSSVILLGIGLVGAGCYTARKKLRASA